MKNYDVIIIGAGSVGVPTALAISKKKMSVLCIDSLPAPGQGNNKKAIGGIRATHSDFGKIKVGLRSIEIFSTWKEKYGTDIGWQTNGYSFVAYDKESENKLKNLIKIQKNFGLNIDWISAEEYQKIVPGINPKNLRGATYSPDDGSASNLLAINAWWTKSLEFGAEYKFNEKVIDLKLNDNKVTQVVTNRETYFCKYVINAAGNNANEIGEMANITLNVKPDSHEGAITEPVKQFMQPMVVDLREGVGSKNYYFYQNSEGQVVFCITPN
ncbi:MAG: FAD-dependent oxidoreductase, partial [Candidatus Cloacimonadota bacterium]|nr:FAD-dependent oxidoreductase [Candidatus Cloacimonadota bacterium]